MHLFRTVLQQTVRGGDTSFRWILERAAKARSLPQFTVEAATTSRFCCRRRRREGPGGGDHGQQDLRQPFAVVDPGGFHAMDTPTRRIRRSCTASWPRNTSGYEIVETWDTLACVQRRATTPSWTRPSSPTRTSSSCGRQGSPAQACSRSASLLGALMGLHRLSRRRQACLRYHGRPHAEAHLHSAPRSMAHHPGPAQCLGMRISSSLRGALDRVTPTGPRASPTPTAGAVGGCSALIINQAYDIAIWRWTVRWQCRVQGKPSRADLPRRAHGRSTGTRCWRTKLVGKLCLGLNPTTRSAGADYPSARQPVARGIRYSYILGEGGCRALRGGPRTMGCLQLPRRYRSHRSRGAACAGRRHASKSLPRLHRRKQVRWLLSRAGTDPCRVCRCRQDSVGARCVNLAQSEERNEGPRRHHRVAQ